MSKIVIFFLLHLNTMALEWSNDNLVYVTKDGKETQDIRENLIDSAKNIILFSANYAAGELLENMLLAMANKLSKEHDLVIFFIVSPDFLQKEDEILFTKLKNAFPTRFFYIITSFSNTIPAMENHTKILVCDDVAVIGGTGLIKNMCTDGLPDVIGLKKSPFFLEGMLPKKFRDMDVVIKGEAVVQIKKFYYKLFTKWSSEKFNIIKNSHLNKINIDNFIDQSKIFKDIKIKVLSDLKYKEKEKNTYEITNSLVSLIHEAKSSIIFAHMLFSPIEIIKDILSWKIKTNSNIDITLVSNGSFENMPLASKIFIDMNKTNYNLVKTVFGFNVPGALYHKKVVIVDGKFTMIGSYNLSLKSGQYDDEIALLMDSEMVAEEFIKIIEIDKSFSEQVLDKELNIKDKFLNIIQSLTTKNFL